MLEMVNAMKQTIQKKDNVIISYTSDSNYVSFDYKETKTKLVCYMDDGITVYAEYTREKQEVLWR